MKEAAEKSSAAGGNRQDQQEIVMSEVMHTPVTCASCQHIGQMYHYNGSIYNHMCGKADDRRREGMRNGADFFDHFRTFFDATADQHACEHYVERPLASDDVLSLLSSIEASCGRGEFAFFSVENSMAEKIDGKFVRSKMHAQKSAPGNRVFTLLPVGKAEVKRAAIAKATGAAA